MKFGIARYQKYKKDYVKHIAFNPAEHNLSEFFHSLNIMFLLINQNFPFITLFCSYYVGARIA